MTVARDWTHGAGRIAVIVMVIMLPVLLRGNLHFLNLANMAGIYFIVCIGLSLIFGIGGQLSLAHGIFYGIGAYTSAILTTRIGLPVMAGVAAAGLVCGVLAFILARPLLRLRTVYLALATLAFGEIVITLIREQSWLTGGSTGIINLPSPKVLNFAFDDQFKYYYLIWAVALAVAWIFSNLTRSRLGLGLRALADSEIGAAACGIDIASYKSRMFTLGAVFAGVAGALYVHYIGFISPDSFAVQFSLLIVMILAIGGRDTLLGAFIGAVFVTVAPIFLADLEKYSTLVFGLLFLGSVMFLPNGIAGSLTGLVTRVSRSGGAKP